MIVCPDPENCQPYGEHYQHHQGRSRTCVCGHDAAHHDRRKSVYAGLMADYKVVWACGWTGCGCPRFVTADARHTFVGGPDHCAVCGGLPSDDAHDGWTPQPTDDASRQTRDTP